MDVFSSKQAQQEICALYPFEQQETIWSHAVPVSSSCVPSSCSGWEPTALTSSEYYVVFHWFAWLLDLSNSLLGKVWDVPICQQSQLSDSTEEHFWAEASRRCKITDICIYRITPAPLCFLQITSVKKDKWRILNNYIEEINLADN